MSLLLLVDVVCQATTVVVASSVVLPCKRSCKVKLYNCQVFIQNLKIGERSEPSAGGLAVRAEGTVTASFVKLLNDTLVWFWVRTSRYSPWFDILYVCYCFSAKPGSRMTDGTKYPVRSGNCRLLPFKTVVKQVEKRRRKRCCLLEKATAKVSE